MIKKQKHGGFIDHQHMGVGVGKKTSSLVFFLALRAHSRLSRSPMFSKRTKNRLSSFRSRFQRSSIGLWYLKALFCMADTKDQTIGNCFSLRIQRILLKGEREKQKKFSRDPPLASRARRASSTRVREG